MQSVRVIPCLDVDAGRVVKGVQFLNLRTAVVLSAAKDLFARREPRSG